MFNKFGPREIKFYLGLAHFEGDKGGSSGGSTGGAGDSGSKGEGDKGKGQGDGGQKPDAKDARIAELEAALAAAKGGGSKGDDGDLRDKAQKEQQEKDRRASETRDMESALKFDMESEKFLTTNKALLPEEIGEIFKAAKKENYSSAVEKSQALKSGIVQSFFAVQANVDLLTPAQKSVLDGYLKLTKTEKQGRAAQIYDSVFEPTFEMLKRIKKAEALSKGYGGGSDDENAYRDKLSKLSRQHYLGEKANA